MNEDGVETEAQGPQTLNEFIEDELQFAKQKAIEDGYRIQSYIKQGDLGRPAPKEEQQGIKRLMQNSAAYYKKVEEAQDALNNDSTEPAVAILQAKIDELNQLINTNSAVGQTKDAKIYIDQLKKLTRLKEKV